VPSGLLAQTDLLLCYSRAVYKGERECEQRSGQTCSPRGNGSGLLAGRAAYFCYYNNRSFYCLALLLTDEALCCTSTVAVVTLMVMQALAFCPPVAGLMAGCAFHCGSLLLAENPAVAVAAAAFCSPPQSNTGRRERGNAVTWRASVKIGTEEPNQALITGTFLS
jgi:hypothetical protein